AVSTTSIGGTVTNLTAGRNMRSDGVGLIALYPIEADACVRGSGISLTGTSWQDSAYCYVGLGRVPEQEPAPEAARGAPIARGDVSLGEFDEAGTALADLNSPVSVYAAFGSLGSGLTNVAWEGDRGCKVSTRYAGAHWVVPADGWPDVLCATG